MLDIARKIRERQDGAEDAPPVLIALIGDSVTRGCFDTGVDAYGGLTNRVDPDACYAGQLQSRLNARFPRAAVCVLNAGVSGDTAPGGLERLDAHVLRRRPDLVVIAFGLNDAHGWQRPDKTAGYSAAMRGMIRRAHGQGAECIVLTPLPMCSTVSARIAHPRLQEIAAQCARVQTGGGLALMARLAREAAQAEGAALADAYAAHHALADSPAWADTGLANHINHPTAQGHALLLDALWPCIAGEA